MQVGLDKLSSQRHGALECSQSVLRRAAGRSSMRDDPRGSHGVQNIVPDSLKPAVSSPRASCENANARKYVPLRLNLASFFRLSHLCKFILTYPNRSTI